MMIRDKSYKGICEYIRDKYYYKGNCELDYTVNNSPIHDPQEDVNITICVTDTDFLTLVSVWAYQKGYDIHDFISYDEDIGFSFQSLSREKAEEYTTEILSEIQLNN